MALPALYFRVSLYLQCNISQEGGAKLGAFIVGAKKMCHLVDTTSSVV